MATTDQIAQLRKMVGTTDLDDTTLGEMIDDNDGNLNIVAAEIWQEKASSYANLVNIKEGSSSRDLGMLYKNALDMAAHFSGSGPTNVARTRPMVREGGF